MTSHRKPLLPRIGPLDPLPTEKVRKARRTAVACTPCHQKKLKCNGARPICAACKARQTRCKYLTQEESETRREARTREHKGLKDLIECLLTVPEETAHAVLHELRSSTDPISVLRRYESGQILPRISEITTALSALPQIQSQTELQLMIQHPAGYPVVELSHDDILSSNTLLEALKIPPIDIPCGSKSQSKAKIVDCSDVSGVPPLPRQGHLDIRLANDLQPMGENAMPEASIPTYFDTLLHCLDISFWTSVSVTDRYAAGAISAYLMTDHTILRFFDVTSFLNDLIHLRGGPLFAVPRELTARVCVATILCGRTNCHSEEF